MILITNKLNIKNNKLNKTKKFKYTDANGVVRNVYKTEENNLSPICVRYTIECCNVVAISHPNTDISLMYEKVDKNKK